MLVAIWWRYVSSNDYPSYHKDLIPYWWNYFLCASHFEYMPVKFTYTNMSSMKTDSWSSLLEAWRERFRCALAAASSGWSSFKPNCEAFIWFCWKISFWWKFQGNVTQKLYFTSGNLTMISFGRYQKLNDFWFLILACFCIVCL